MVRIPIAGDVAELIGTAAEKVENRSLLLDKFVFHKCWPVVKDAKGYAVKWDEASRWSFMRIAEGASGLLSKDASEKLRRSRGQNVELENATRFRAEAQVAEALAKVSWDTQELADLRAQHTRCFLRLFRGAYGGRSSVCIGQLEGRLAINLADSLIQNAGICLDRMFGLPFIPGSAIKGVCRHTALEELRAAAGDKQAQLFELFRGVFGTADNDYVKGDLKPYRHLLQERPENQKGSVAFLPAYPVNQAKLVVDLTNVHYPDYYQTGQVEELSKERPRPNPFPAVEAGAQFAFCLVLNGVAEMPALLQTARRWLETAITVRGLGAKTAAGYGWFSLQPSVLDEIDADEQRVAEAVKAKAKAEAEAKAKAAAESARLAAMKPEDRARDHFAAMNQEQFASAVSGIVKLTTDEQRGLLMALLLPARRDTWKSWKKSDKPANKARVEAALATAKNLGMTLT